MKNPEQLITWQLRLHVFMIAVCVLTIIYYLWRG